MIMNFFIRTVTHLMLGFLSVGISLVVFEGFLNVIPGDKNEVVENLPKEEVFTNQIALRTETPESPKREMVKQKSVCSSDYFAVIDAASNPFCVRNPTPLMAHWGPPSPAWFRTLGGEFRLQDADVTQPEHCSCLAGQNAYKPEDNSNQVRSPITSIVFDNTKTPISKWVCGDPCMTIAKGGVPHES